MNNQRQAKSNGLLANARAADLEALPGWSWNPQADAWHDAFTRVNMWIAEHGTLPKQGGDDAAEASLAKWVNNQRQAALNGSLTEPRAAALESLPGWRWNLQTAGWNDYLARVKMWVTEHGRLPKQGSADVLEASLAIWMKHQRQAQSNGSLTNARVVALETWSDWTWVPREDQWQASLSALQLWLSEHEHEMPQRNSENHAEAALATWADHQRSARQKGMLAEERSLALEHLSAWSWQPREVQWEAWYQLAWDWFFGPPCSMEAPRASYPRSTKDHGMRPLSLESVLAGEVQSFSDDLEDEDSEHLPSHHVQEESAARPLALWMLRQRRAYRRGELPESRSLRLQQLPRWTWTRVGGELEPQQSWAHHFKHVLDWRTAHQGRMPSEVYPDSAFERRLAEWFGDNRCQFRNAMSDPTSPGACHERVKLAPRKCKVPETEEERLLWSPTSSAGLTRDERAHWVKTLPKLFGSWDFWSWCKMDQYLKAVLCQPEKYRPPLRHPDKNQEWGPDWTAFFNRIDPSILAPRAFDHIWVRSPPMPWERVRPFMQLLREQGGHMRLRGNTKAQELLVEVDAGLIDQGAHKRAGSTVGCPCCVPELHVCQSFPALRRCNYHCPPYEFVCTKGVWRCTGQWSDSLFTVGLSPPLPSGQLRLDALFFRTTSARSAPSSGNDSHKTCIRDRCMHLLNVHTFGCHGQADAGSQIGSRMCGTDA